MVVEAMQPRGLTLDLGVLFLLVGFGLLQHKAFWRRVALVVAWAAVFTAPALSALAYYYHPVVELSVSALGQNLNPHSPTGIAATAGAVLIVMAASGWVIWTLQRDPIKRQFAS